MNDGSRGSNLSSGSAITSLGMLVRSDSYMTPCSVSAEQAGRVTGAGTVLAERQVRTGVVPQATGPVTFIHNADAELAHESICGHKATHPTPNDEDGLACIPCHRRRARSAPSTSAGTGTGTLRYARGRGAR